jgi:hypothetical protein
MGGSVSLLIGILIACALPFVLVAVALTLAWVGGRRPPPAGTAPPGWYDDPRHDAPLRWGTARAGRRGPTTEAWRESRPPPLTRSMDVQAYSR